MRRDQGVVIDAQLGQGIDRFDADQRDPVDRRPIGRAEAGRVERRDVGRFRVQHRSDLIDGTRHRRSQVVRRLGSLRTECSVRADVGESLLAGCAHPGARQSVHQHALVLHLRPRGSDSVTEHPSIVSQNVQVESSLLVVACAQPWIRPRRIGHDAMKDGDVLLEVHQPHGARVENLVDSAARHRRPP
ncbi:hypothetical protein D8W71_13055 [Rhodococcus sp. P1Y]|nr:hypothetical protein D8W71_13055 [Rhodococcus sp. P1Y]